jgi:tetratricopeptide (TPR) repeat protein
VVALDGADAEACSLLGTTLWTKGDYEGARIEAERALAISPNLAYAHSTLGVTLMFSGRPSEGLVALERSLRFEPRGPTSAVHLHQIAIAQSNGDPQSGNVKALFEQYISQYAASKGHKAFSDNERQVLFDKFQQFLATENQAVNENSRWPVTPFPIWCWRPVSGAQPYQLP